MALPVSSFSVQNFSPHGYHHRHACQDIHFFKRHSIQRHSNIAPGQINGNHLKQARSSITKLIVLLTFNLTYCTFSYIFFFDFYLFTNTVYITIIYNNNLTLDRPESGLFGIPHNILTHNQVNLTYCWINPFLHTCTRHTQASAAWRAVATSAVRLQAARPVWDCTEPVCSRDDQSPSFSEDIMIIVSIFNGQPSR